jgi:hypothetical protein
LTSNANSRKENEPEAKWRRRKRFRRSVMRREMRLGPATLNDDDDDDDDDDEDRPDNNEDDVAKWEHPLIRTGKFRNRRKQRSLACCSDSKGAARVRRVTPVWMIALKLRRVK